MRKPRQRFGTIILNQPLEQSHYSLMAQLVGWACHFSNGLTFDIMYVALIGSAAHRHWTWAVVFAVGLELGMLFTPYPAFFHIPLTAKFVVVALTAHLVFGIVMGKALPGSRFAGLGPHDPEDDAGGPRRVGLRVGAGPRSMVGVMPDVPQS